MFLWAEACNTTVYLQNRSLHGALGYLTSEEAFSRKKPDIGHLCIFGCITYSYIPKEKRTKLEATIEKASELCEIWHCRMGHMYHGALRNLREITTCVPDFSTDHFDTCRGCAMGKFAKSPFPSSDNRATGILDLIHSDVSGRMSYVSLSAYEYYVLFIDDHSRRTWIYFLKTKSEVLKWFQEFRALVEIQTGRKIKSLRSDNGGEYHPWRVC